MVVMRAVWTVYEGRNTRGHFSFAPSGLISPKSGHYRPGTYVPFSTYLLGLGFGIIIPPQFGKRPFLLSVPAARFRFETVASQNLGENYLIPKLKQNSQVLMI